MSILSRSHKGEDVATQSRNLYDDEQMKALRADYEGTSLGDHVNNVMEAAVDDVKSVVEAAVEAPVKVLSFVDRGGVYYIAGVLSGMGLMVLARLLN
jgi:hypothetical protein